MHGLIRDSIIKFMDLLFLNKRGFMILMKDIDINLFADNWLPATKIDCRQQRRWLTHN